MLGIGQAGNCNQVNSGDTEEVQLDFDVEIANGGCASSTESSRNMPNIFITTPSNIGLPKRVTRPNKNKRYIGTWGASLLYACTQFLYDVRIRTFYYVLTCQVPQQIEIGQKSLFAAYLTLKFS